MDTGYLEHLVPCLVLQMTHHPHVHQPWRLDGCTPCIQPACSVTWAVRAGTCTPSRDTCSRDTCQHSLQVQWVRRPVGVQARRWVCSMHLDVPGVPALHLVDGVVQDLVHLAPSNAIQKVKSRL